MVTRTSINVNCKPMNLSFIWTNYIRTKASTSIIMIPEEAYQSTCLSLWGINNLEWFKEIQVSQELILTTYQLDILIKVRKTNILCCMKNVTNIKERLRNKAKKKMNFKFKLTNLQNQTKCYSLTAHNWCGLTYIKISSISKVKIEI